MSIMLADYIAQRQTFEALLQANCQKNILLFRGESGSGKTALLTDCLERVPPTIRCVPIQLRGSAVSMAEIFYRAGSPLGWEHLSHFTQQVADLQGTPEVHVDRNWQTGSNNSINVALHAESQLDREHRRAALTEAWFEDLKAFAHPVLFAFDTYEDGTSEVKEWISGPLLARAAYVNQVRILVAGQTVPDENNIEWGHRCATRDLFGVPEARHWLPIVEAMDRHIPFGDPLSWLAGVCHVLKGRPLDIMNVIKGLPYR